MTLIGQLALALALVLALYSIGANIFGLRRGRNDVLLARATRFGP
jgi:hypothetical protein